MRRETLALGHLGTLLKLEVIQVQVFQQDRFAAQRNPFPSSWRYRFHGQASLFPHPERFEKAFPFLLP